jgi:hypothetical protein
MACHMSCRLTLRVTSLIRTGARRLDRSFLCTQRKLISAASNVLRTSQRTIFPMRSLAHFDLTRNPILIPEMKATSFLVLITRTPMCQSGKYPGDVKALETNM